MSWGQFGLLSAYQAQQWYITRSSLEQTDKQFYFLIDLKVESLRPDPSDELPAVPMASFFLKSFLWVNGAAWGELKRQCPTHWNLFNKDTKINQTQQSLHQLTKSLSQLLIYPHCGWFHYMSSGETQARGLKAGTQALTGHYSQCRSQQLESRKKPHRINKDSTMSHIPSIRVETGSWNPP